MPATNVPLHRHSRAPGAVDPTALASFAYDLAVLGSGPLAFWLLNEPSGTVAADVSGNGHAATYVNSPTQGVGGRFDLAVQLNGTSQYLSVSTLTSFPTTGSYTLEALVYATASRNQGIVGYGSYGTTRHVNAFKTVSATELQNYWWGDDYNQTGCPTVLNTWRHVAAVWDSGANRRRIFVNGVQIGGDNTPGGSPAFDLTNFTIGVTTAGSAEYWQGMIQRVAIYGTALTATQLLAHVTALP